MRSSSSNQIIVRARFVMSFFLLATAIQAQVTVPTAQYNNSRTAANLNETTLTVSNVGVSTFGKLFSRKVDAEVYAAPLFVPNVAIPNKGNHNVVYVATGNNTIYAFDADDPGMAEPLWKRHLGPALHIGERSSDVRPYWGILSTPVIHKGVLYAATVFTENIDKWPMYLSAIDITTGEDKYGPPAEILFPNQGQMISGTTATIQRAALLAANNMIYVAFTNFLGKYDDHPHATGFIFAYSAQDIKKPVAIFQPAKDQGACGNGVVWRGGGVWQAGRGLAADESGNVFFSTANGYFDGVTNFGDTLLKLAPDLKIKDWFTPATWQNICQSDMDLGSSGPILLPGTPGYVVAMGKEGTLYMLNRANLGHLQTAATPRLPAQFEASHGCHPANCSQTPSLAYWNRDQHPMLYVWDTQDVLRSYPFTNGRPAITPNAVGKSAATMIGGVSVSSNQSVAGTGILWAITSNNTIEGEPGDGTVHAYDATNITQELWNSDMNPARDAMGKFTKFSMPVVANGKVYIITQSNELQVYGLLKMLTP